MKHLGVEVNGPSNIIMHLDSLLLASKISQQDYDLLVKEAKKTIHYLKELTNPKGVKWFEMSYLVKSEGE